MKARLYVVDESTYRDTLSNMEITIKVPQPTKKLWNKTLIDIMSDLYQVEIGDYAFLWEAGGEGLIYGVYRIVSRPYFIPGATDERIFGMKIEQAYGFDKAIREYDVLNDPALKGQMWNVIGKKLAGKSRANTPITKEETNVLIQMLINCNDNYAYYPMGDVVTVTNELSFNISDPFKKYTPKSLNLLDMDKIAVREGRKVKYEKSLELILNEMCREKSALLSSLDIKADNIIWYGNYLPYGIERSEIDYIISESLDGTHTTGLNLIELMKEKADEDHINRCLQYSRWCVDYLFCGNNIVRPVLICARTTTIDDSLKEYISNHLEYYGFKEINIYRYDMHNGGIEFSRIM